MSKKILIMVASKAGSTAEIAKFIGEKLTKAGATVAVKQADEAINPTGYDAVIVGSPIYMGKWLSEASNFVETNQQILKKLPTAFFLTALNLNDPAKQGHISNYLAEQRKLVMPISEGRFAGKLDYSKLSFFNRMIAKIVGAKEGDFRDWQAIEQWAVDFYAALGK